MALQYFQKRLVDRQLRTGADSGIVVEPSATCIACTDSNKRRKRKWSLKFMALQRPSASTRKTFQSLISKDLDVTRIRSNRRNPLKKAGFQSLSGRFWQSRASTKNSSTVKSGPFLEPEPAGGSSSATGSDCQPTSLDPLSPMPGGRRVYVGCDTCHFAAAGSRGPDPMRRDAKIP